MLRNHKIIAIAALGFSFAVLSCRKQLDVNKNPNVAETTTVAALLPVCEVYIASGIGVDLQVNGCMWAQYWTQIPTASQYRTYDQYEPTSQTYEYAWASLYSGAGINLVQLDELAQSQNKAQYRAIALLLKAYLFQVITDGWGDVPFSQALTAGITSPKYDAQQAIYTGILAYIDSANALINVSDPAAPSSDDLLYGGNMAEWQKFSNTLRLKILLRMSEKNISQAQAGIAALYATGPSFIGTGDDAMVSFTSASGNKNPLYSEFAGVNYAQNLVASNTCIDSMVSNGDARVGVFYEADGNGSYTGTPQGSQASIATASLPSYFVAGDAGNDSSATAPVKFLTSYESYFLQAEAVARGLGATGDDNALFIQGITASFNAYKIQLTSNGINSDSALAAYLAHANWAQYPTAGTAAQKQQWIITQKWFSMCGNQGLEAWTEWRRTGYPNFFTISQSSLIGNVFPRRLLYPYSEVTTNGSFPGLAPITSSVWWDIH